MGSQAKGVHFQKHIPSSMFFIGKLRRLEITSIRHPTRLFPEHAISESKAPRKLPTSKTTPIPDLRRLIHGRRSRHRRRDLHNLLDAPPRHLPISVASASAALSTLLSPLLSALSAAPSQIASASSLRLNTLSPLLPSPLARFTPRRPHSTTPPSPLPSKPAAVAVAVVVVASVAQDAVAHEQGPQGCGRGGGNADADLDDGPGGDGDVDVEEVGPVGEVVGV
ncbi:hypothetical protein AOQ84DRAFT_362485, partial [Glonium stellatum]